MKRQGGAGTVIAVVLILLLVAVAGLFFLNGLGIKSSLNGGLSDLTKGVSVIQSQGSSLQIASVSLIANTFDGSEPLPPTCGTASSNSYITLTNSGTSSGGVASVTITYGGANNLFDVAGSCEIGAASTGYILFPGPSALPNSTAPQPSEPFQGSVNLSNGVKLPFSGQFQQGYPMVFSIQTSLVASQLSQGKANASCQYSPPSVTSYVELSDNGTEGISASQVTLEWNGTSVVLPISGACALGQGGTQNANVFLVVYGVGTVNFEPKAGESYTLTVLLPNGAAAPLTVETTGSFR